MKGNTLARLIYRWLKVWLRRSNLVNRLHFGGKDERSIEKQCKFKYKPLSKIVLAKLKWKNATDKLIGQMYVGWMNARPNPRLSAGFEAVGKLADW